MTQQEASYEGHHDQIEHSETPGETELPEFTVNDVWSLFDEGYGQEIQAGLIATVTMRHIDEILDEPWVEWRGTHQPNYPSGRESMDRHRILPLFPGSRTAIPRWWRADAQ